MTTPTTASGWQGLANKQVFAVGGFVDGDFRHLRGHELICVNPATEEVLAAFPAASEADVDSAVRAARQAFDAGPGLEWRRKSARQSSSGSSP